VADPKKDEAPAAASGAPDAGAGGPSKLMTGILALNMVMMLAVAVVLYLGQKKQAQQQTLDQVAQGEAASEKAAEHGGGGGEHGGGGGEHGGGHGGGEHGGGHGGGEPTAETRFFPVGDFTANLAGPASAHYVKVTVNFEMSKEADEEEFKARKPQFRDKVISLLNAKQPADLQSAEGRNYLKEEIKTVSNTFLKKGKVEGVYFSAFVVN